MSYLTKYGNIFGALPMTVGNVFFVAPSASYQVAGRSFTASDDNDGLSPERAVLTISRAIALASSDVGDVIALLPGTHSSAAAALSKNGITFVGLPYYPQSAVNGLMSWHPQVTVTGTTGAAIAITGARNSFYHIRFVPVTQQLTISLTTAADRTRFVHCMIDNTGVTGHANTRGIIVTTANLPRAVQFMGCVFKDASVTTSCGAALNLAASVDFLIDKCIVYKDGQIASGTAWTTAIIVESGCTGTIRDCDVIISEVSVGITKVVTGAALAGAGVFHAIRNTMTVNTGGLLLDDFAAADVDLCNNYVATVAGGTGGTLITVST